LQALTPSGGAHILTRIGSTRLSTKPASHC
jgi:hypothetical protein